MADKVEKKFAGFTTEDGKKIKIDLASYPKAIRESGSFNLQLYVFIMSQSHLTDEIVKAFISVGWNINALIKYDEELINDTPLNYACISRDYNTIKLLLENGANPNTKGENKINAFESIFLGEECNGDDWENVAKIIRLLRKYNVDMKMDRWVLLSLLPYTKKPNFYPTLNEKE